MKAPADTVQSDCMRVCVSVCLFTGASLDAHSSGFNELLHYLVGGSGGSGGPRGRRLGGLTWPMCVSLYHRLDELQSAKIKKKKSAIPLNDNLSQLFFYYSSSFITLPPPNPTTRTAHPSLGQPISSTSKVTHYSHPSWLFFFSLERTSVYVRVSFPI